MVESSGAISVINSFEGFIAVVVLFRATGDAPIMKQSKFKVCEISTLNSCPYFTRGGSREFSFLCRIPGFPGMI